MHILSKEMIVLVTGGFDPIHSGHIKLFNNAKILAPRLIVGINSDEWLTRKKGKPFMPLYDRQMIIKHLHMVDRILTYDDSDDTSNNAIQYLLDTTDDDIVFANGGDRHNENVPELIKYKDHERVNFAWGIGGVGKQQSSSWLLQQWNENISN